VHLRPSDLLRSLLFVLALPMASLLSAAPAVTEGLKLHLRATDLGLDDGAPVTAWNDVSGAGNHADRGFFGRALPSFDADGAGGAPAVYFNGGSSIGGDGGLGFANSDVTAFLVFRPERIDRLQVPVYLGPGPGSPTRGLALSKAQGGGQTSVRFNDGRAEFYDSGFPSDRPSLMTVRYADGGRYDSAELWANRNPQPRTGATGADQFLSLAAETFMLGISATGDSGEAEWPFQGWIAELLVYNRALSDAEIAEMQEDLLAVYTVDLVPDRPNILLAMADDWGWPHAGVYGASWLRTPNFDRMADEGVLFQNAFTNSPSCTPSRGTALTGRMPWRLGTGATIYGSLPASLPTYTDLLEADGYHLGYTGKGWGPGSITAGGRSRNPAGPAFNARSLSSKPSNQISGIDYAANFRDFLAARDPGQPFCFCYGAFEPHRNYESGSGRNKGGLDRSAVAVPGFFPDNNSVRDDMLDYAWEVEHMDDHLGQMLDYLELIGELDNTVVIVTGDHGMPFPRAKKNLYELGAHVPFAVRWGDGARGGRSVDDLVAFVDLAPTILEIAGVAPPEGMVLDGRSFTDLLAAEAEGLVFPGERSHRFIAIERHDIVGKNETLTGRAGAGYPSRAVRSARYLYIRNDYPDWFPYASDAGPTHSAILALDGGNTQQQALYDLNYAPRPAEELYNILDDPDCLNNLAADPVFDAVRQDLAARLEAKQRETRDPRILGYGDIFFANPFHKFGGGRYEAWDEAVEEDMEEGGLAPDSHTGADDPSAQGAPLSILPDETAQLFRYRLSIHTPEFQSHPQWSLTPGSGWTETGLTVSPAERADGYQWWEARIEGAQPPAAFFRLITTFEPAFQ